jgi:arylsulfatase A-like enzyme
MNNKLLLAYLTFGLLCFSQINAANKPNILFIVSDDLNACLGSYGNEVCQTPNLDRLASEGVQFNRAYCQYPVCGPSRASFMSGLYPKRTKMLGNNYTLGSYKVTNPGLANHPSIGELLRTNGYVSLRVSKIYHMGVPGGIEAGDAGGDEPDSWDRAFNVMAPETASPGTLELLSPKRTHYGSNFARIIVPDDRIETQADILAANQAIAILESRARDGDHSKFIRPDDAFFLAVGFVRPHVPLVAPKSLFRKYPEEKSVLPFVPKDDLDDIPTLAATNANELKYGMSELQQKQSLAAYYASVSFMDQQVGRLLDTLDRLDLRKDTVVIFTSDHGYNLGHHTLWQKGSLFENSVRVPLLISAPGFESAAGKSSDALVELVDLYPTIAELTGLSEKVPSNLDGLSLTGLLKNPSRAKGHSEAYTVVGNRQRMGESIKTDRYRYNYWSGGEEELYDQMKDPEEFTNLVASSEHTIVLKQMRTRLAEKNRSF